MNFEFVVKNIKEKLNNILLWALANEIVLFHSFHALPPVCFIICFGHLHVVLICFNICTNLTIAMTTTVPLVVNPAEAGAALVTAPATLIPTNAQSVNYFDQNGQVVLCNVILLG